MQTKSNIQLIREALVIKEAFKNEVKNIVENYLVKDSVFSFDGKKLNETLNGYFDIEKEYESLNEALDNLNFGDYIRIINDEKYQIGKVYQKLSETKNKNVFDITTNQMISE